jgi:hypothetical protein
MAEDKNGGVGGWRVVELMLNRKSSKRLETGREKGGISRR